MPFANSIELWGQTVEHLYSTGSPGRPQPHAGGQETPGWGGRGKNVVRGRTLEELYCSYVINRSQTD